MGGGIFSTPFPKIYYLKSLQPLCQVCHASARASFSPSLAPVNSLGTAGILHVCGHCVSLTQVNKQNPNARREATTDEEPENSCTAQPRCSSGVRNRPCARHLKPSSNTTLTQRPSATPSPLVWIRPARRRSGSSAGGWPRLDLLPGPPLPEAPSLLQQLPAFGLLV